MFVVVLLISFILPVIFICTVDTLLFFIIRERGQMRRHKEVIFWVMKQMTKGRGEIDRELVSADVLITPPIDCHPPLNVPVNQKVVLYPLHIHWMQPDTEPPHSLSGMGIQTFTSLAVFTSFTWLGLQWMLDSTSSFLSHADHTHQTHTYTQTHKSQG